MPFKIFNFDIGSLLIAFHYNNCAVIFNQWHKNQQEGAKSNVFLGFAILLLAISLSLPIYILRRYYFGETHLFDMQFRIGVMLMSVGAILFSLTLEWEFREFLKVELFQEI